MARLHWFWRAAIAVLAACIYMGLSVTLFERFNEAVLHEIVMFVGGSWPGPGWQIGAAISLVYGLPVAIIAVVAYAWLARRSGPRAVREIPCPKCGYIGHCRKCGYNLTGNVSGICPECGEKVSGKQSA
jgi:hypothetical protein